MQEVQKHLVHLGRVAGDGPQIGGGRKTHADGLGEGVAHHLEQIAHEMKGIDQDALALYPSREGQHLLDQIRAALRVVVQRGQHGAIVVVPGQFAQELDGHQNRREHIVQVVRNAAGQSTDALHALGAEELGLEALFLGDVGVDRENGLGPAVRVPHQGPADLHRDVAAIFRPRDDLALPGAFGYQRCQRRPEPGGILVEHLDSGAAQHFSGGPAVHVLGALVPIDDATVQLTDLNPFVGDIEQRGLLAHLYLSVLAFQF